MIKGKTTSGFTYQLSNERLNNYELIEAIGELETNPLQLTKVVHLLLGKGQTAKLKEHVRTEDGLVPADLLSAEITEIFQKQAKTKN